LTIEKSFMSGRAWHTILKKICKVIKPHRSSEEVIIFVVNASPHKDMETIEYLIQEKVYLVFISPDVTDLIQPLDDKILACWRLTLWRRT
jgi:hypothetical protein